MRKLGFPFFSCPRTRFRSLETLPKARNPRSALLYLHCRLLLLCGVRIARVLDCVNSPCTCRQPLPLACRFGFCC
ncbi:hypothetical protein SLEP1_g27696 [Rubroshorea leprosula]|uniref:Uncharacterized protein n=1 Tax=Rubroshorea leprosula TaxID=152421 RepID=A0AAV5K2L9_9ROSI|nr:hypothetical protein SLEP1_g27696 [Rubroshorea leprosula]